MNHQRNRGNWLLSNNFNHHMCPVTEEIRHNMLSEANLRPNLPENFALLMSDQTCANSLVQYLHQIGLQAFIWHVLVVLVRPEPPKLRACFAGSPPKKKIHLKATGSNAKERVRGHITFFLLSSNCASNCEYGLILLNTSYNIGKKNSELT